MANKKTARKASALRMNEARKTNLASIRNTAFQAGVSRSAVIAAVAAAMGRKPILALYNAGKLELQIGFMAAALERKRSSLSETEQRGLPRDPERLMDHCRVRLTEYAGHESAGKLKEGQRGRRTAAEEAAYGSARVLVSAVMKEAGVTVPETRGGNTANTRSPSHKAKTGKSESAKRPVAPTFKTATEVVGYVQQQGKMLLAFTNKHAKIAPNELKSAIADFNKAIAAIK